MQKIPSSYDESDYNNMVDDIFSLKPKELSVTRLEFKRKHSKCVQNRGFSESYFFWEDEEIERSNFIDGSESNINEHFNKIFQQKEESVDESDLFPRFELAHKELDEAANQDSPKYEFSFNMSDRDKEEFENISYWTEFLLNDVNKKNNSTHSEFNID
jgi:hypothetical protein